MFDFLSEGDEEQTARRKVAKKSKRRVMPTIRPPVPVSKSGPLLPPKPGDPVEPPPPLTTAKRAKNADDLDFLEDTRSNAPDLRPVDKKRTASTRPNNVRPLTQSPANDEDIELEKEFSSLKRDNRDELDFGNDWREGLATTFEQPEEDPKESLIRWFALGTAALLLVGGGSYLYFSGKLDQLIPSQSELAFDDEFLSDTQNAELSPSLNAPVESDQNAGAAATDPVAIDTDTALNNAAVDTTSNIAEPSSLWVRFSDELAALEALVSNGAYDDAEQALSSMDRTLYGYGASEFQAIEARIAELKTDAAGQQQALEAAEAARQEERRQAEAAAARAASAEAARLAEVRRAEQLAAEQERLKLQREAEQAAANEAARLEEQRLLAAQEAEALRQEQALARQQAQARVEAAAEEARQRARAAADEAATTEASRREAARLEQLEQARTASELAAARADKIRLDALEETAREEARRQIAEADRLATDRRIAEERAAAERRAVLEQRIARTREIEAANAAAAQAESRAQNRNVVIVAESQATEVAANNASVVNAAPRAITDDELQTVYRKFTDLQNAISSRDIGQVVSLTKRSGLRVQQFMQVFENSVGIDVRIRNVSTSNATGEINGTLQIQSIERADGSRAVPPSNMQSIRLTSSREGNDWSAISW